MARNSTPLSTTRWSVVADAASGHQAALQWLCSRYWDALYVYARRHGRSPGDAEERVQSFFETLLRRNDLAKADAARGRFRSFLLTSFKNSLHSDHAARNAERRGGKVEVFSMDATEAESWLSDTEARSPEQDFDRAWARRTVGLAMARLKAGQRDPQVFDALSPYVLDTGPDYATVAAELSMTDGAVRVAVHRLRKRFGRVLREVVADTLDDARTVDEELRHLLDALA